MGSHGIAAGAEISRLAEQEDIWRITDMETGAGIRRTGSNVAG
jgi:hypothetical protein